MTCMGCWKQICMCSPWVRVEDGLPDRSCTLLVYDNSIGLNPVVAWFEKTEECSYFMNHNCDLKVLPTHWIYIPELPK